MQSFREQLKNGTFKKSTTVDVNIDEYLESNTPEDNYFLIKESRNYRRNKKWLKQSSC